MDRREFFFTGASLPLALSVASRAGATPIVDDPAVTAVIEDALTREHASGLAFAAVQGTRQFIRTAGLASPAFALPVAPDTRFHVGSLTKHITATAILRLVDQGQLSLDTTLGELIAEVSPDWGSRTLHQILTHSGGLPEYTGKYAFHGFDRPLTREGMFELTRNTQPLAPAGESFFYSNAAYTLLGYAIENVTGESYADHMRALFEAAGMPDARADDGQAAVPRRAEPFMWEGDSLRRAPQMATTTSSVAAGGLLFSTRDVPPWEAALDGPGMLSRKSLATLFEPVRYASGRSSGYAMGWLVDSIDGETPAYVHTGSVPGFLSYHVRVPGKRFSMMLMTTGTLRVADLGNRIAEALCPGTTPFGLEAVVDSDPALTERTKVLLLRTQPPEPELLASELAILPPPAVDYSMARVPAGETLQRVELVQERRSGADHWRRYRLHYPEFQSHVIAAHDPAGRFCFLRNC